MSGLTPILDTLLHQVLGKKVDLQSQLPRALTLPVAETIAAQPVRPISGDEDPLRHQNQAQIANSNLAQKTGDLRNEAQRAYLQGSQQLGNAAAKTDFTPSARLIADIFASSDRQAAAVHPASPLGNQGSTELNAAELARYLAASVRNSGLFYESHLASWYGGRLPASRLAAQPQMLLGTSLRPLVEGDKSAKVSSRQQADYAVDQALDADSVTRPIVDPVQGKAEEDQGSADQSNDPEGMQDARQKLTTLVRQQLDLLGDKELRWEGELEKGIPLSILLSLPNYVSTTERHQLNSAHRKEEKDWHADFSITLPTLGVVRVNVDNRNNGLAISLASESDKVRYLLDERKAALHDTLNASVSRPISIIASVNRGGHGSE